MVSNYKVLLNSCLFVKLFYTCCIFLKLLWVNYINGELSIDELGFALRVKMMVVVLFSGCQAFFFN